MDVFLDAFFSIDTDNSEEITTEELRAYMEKNNFEEDFVQKWLELFDKSHSGTITLEEYCKSLGLLPKRARMYRTNAKQTFAEPPKKLPSDVQVITVDMPIEQQFEIVEEARAAIGRGLNERDIARQLKQTLDTKLGRLWHVVVVIGSYWINYSHEPDCAFHFKIGRHVFLLWRTPGY